MLRRARLRSLAKVNLDLRILNKKPDGFHELRTVFQTISLADILEIEYRPARRTSVTIHDPEAIPDNLALRAARAVLDAMGVHARVHFRLEKRIPMGGGLGGGSSNAAAVLLALPVLAGRKLELDRLMELGAELGSDVPFFLLGGTALGAGRGTELYPLADIRQEPLLVLTTGLHVSTPDAYRLLNRGLTLDSLSGNIVSFQAFVRALAEMRSAGAASAFSANDFEAAVFDRFPQLKSIQGGLWRLGATGVRMTGSGSAIFAVFHSRSERERAGKGLKGDPVFSECRAVAARIVSRSSYRRLWRTQLSEHLAADRKLWPPHSRYAR